MLIIIQLVFLCTIFSNVAADAKRICPPKISEDHEICLPIVDHLSFSEARASLGNYTRGGEGSICLFVKANSTGPFHLFNIIDEYNDRYIFCYKEKDQIVFEISYNTTAKGEVYKFPFNFKTDEWNYVCFTWKDDILTFAENCTETSVEAKFQDNSDKSYNVDLSLGFPGLKNKIYNEYTKKEKPKEPPFIACFRDVHVFDFAITKDRMRRIAKEYTQGNVIHWKNSYWWLRFGSYLEFGYLNRDLFPCPVPVTTPPPMTTPHPTTPPPPPRPLPTEKPCAKEESEEEEEEEEERERHLAFNVRVQTIPVYSVFRLENVEMPVGKNLHFVG